jgi:hypothetical protein
MYGRRADVQTVAQYLGRFSEVYVSHRYLSSCVANLRAKRGAPNRGLGRSRVVARRARAADETAHYGL